MFAFVALMIVESALVLSLLVITKCSQGEAVQTAAIVTIFTAAVFYARPALVTIGRRLFHTTGTGGA
jgi:hypothetical protein